MFGVVSTSVPEHYLAGKRSDLVRNGCSLHEDHSGRVRVDWPEGTLLNGQTGEYVLASGFTVTLGDPNAKRR